MTSLIMLINIGTTPGKRFSFFAEKSIPHIPETARQGIANPCQHPFLTQKNPDDPL